jgi:hypothetical protein
MASQVVQEERWLKATGDKHADLVHRLAEAVVAVEYNSAHAEAVSDIVIRHAKGTVKDLSLKLNRLSNRRTHLFKMVGGVRR